MNILFATKKQKNIFKTIRTGNLEIKKKTKNDTNKMENETKCY